MSAMAPLSSRGRTGFHAEARERAAGDRQPTASFLIGWGSPASRGLADGGVSCAS